MKKNPIKPYHMEEFPSQVSKEAPSRYFTPLKPQAKQVLTKDFTYMQFKKIANKAPFTLAEWADILHISERTLHRYAKENSVFNGLQVELILLSEKLITMGNALFGKEGFKKWMSSSVFSLANKTPKEFLTSYAGIQELIQVIGRIQYGISA